MARTRGERRPNGPLWWVFMAVAIYAVAAASLAISTADKCGDRLDDDKHWNWIPPEWECGP